VLAEEGGRGGVRTEGDGRISGGERGREFD